MRPFSRNSISLPIRLPIGRPASDASLSTWPREKLKIGRSTRFVAIGKSQPIPPVPESVFQRTGRRRSSLPLEARKAGS